MIRPVSFVARFLAETSDVAALTASTSFVPTGETATVTITAIRGERKLICQNWLTLDALTNSMNTAIALLPLVATTLGVVSSIGGFLLYYNGSVRKRYAAERDFQHLLRNQENISQHLIQLDDSLNDIRTELARLSPKQ